MIEIDHTILTNAEVQAFARMRSFNPRQLFGTGLLIGVMLFAGIIVLSNMGLMPPTIADLRTANNDFYLMGAYAISLAIGFTVAYFMTRPASDAQIQKELDRLHYKDRLADRARVQGETADMQAAKWKDQIAAWILQEYPGVKMVRADHSLAQSRWCALSLPIDFVFPELGLAVQANAEAWNDRQAYEEDEEFETYNSNSLHLSRCCAKHGITLIHVWDSMPMAQIQAAIAEAMEECEGHMVE
ncbi:MAG: hypothetical protein Q4D06_02100 [Coriobacteriia bacterium]|nr:hypothetical protein [Coriobacteriia bacterium]